MNIQIFFFSFHKYVSYFSVKVHINTYLTGAGLWVENTAVAIYSMSQFKELYFEGSKFVPVTVPVSCHPNMFWRKHICCMDYIYWQMFGFFSMHFEQVLFLLLWLSPSTYTSNPYLKSQPFPILLSCHIGFWEMKELTNCSIETKLRELGTPKTENMPINECHIVIYIYANYLCTSRSPKDKLFIH